MKPLSVLCLAGCLMLGARGARAGEGDARQRSTVLFKDGVAAGKAGDYARAEVAFRTSYLLVPTPSTLRNWALTEMKLGKMVEALSHLKVALGSSGWTPEQRAIVQQNLDDAYAATGHISVKTTDGARVAIDGVLVEGAAPFDAPLDVTAGTRQIDARLGSETAHAEVQATPGNVVDVSVPIPRAAQEVPLAVAMPAPPTEGERSLPIATADGEPSRATTWWTTPHALAVGLAATAAVGVGLGISFDVASQAGASDANASRAGLTGQCTGAAVAPPCGALRDKINTVHEEEVLKEVGFAAGAAAGVGAAIVLALVRPGAGVRTGSVRWAPTIAPAAAGVVGSF